MGFLGFGRFSASFQQFSALLCWEIKLSLRLSIFPKKSEKMATDTLTETQTTEKTKEEAGGSGDAFDSFYQEVNHPIELKKICFLQVNANSNFL